MERKSFADMACSVAQCLEVVGEWWSMLIVRDLFLGVTRFDEFQQRLGISRNVLQQRLARLVDAGVVQKSPYSDRPLRYDYRLTDKGRGLWKVLAHLMMWGDEHYAAEAGRPRLLVHRGCGGEADGRQHCTRCGAELERNDVELVPGPALIDA